MVATGESNLAYKRAKQKLVKFGFRTHTPAFRAVEQSSILSAKFDCPVARDIGSWGSGVRTGSQFWYSHCQCFVALLLF